jgi:hypothetical protein
MQSPKDGAMRSWLDAAPLALLLACSSPDELRSDPQPGTEQDQDTVKVPDAGRDGGSKTPDAGGTKDAGPSEPSESDAEFVECAQSRVEARQTPRAGNVVFVIDTSGSMDEEAALVQQNINRFVEATTSAGLSDYRVLMVSEQSFVDVPDPLRSDRQHFLYVEEEVGSNEPLADLLKRFGDYASFLLPDVMTHFVVVTDDESSISADDFITQMDAKLAGPFRVHAVASPSSGNMSAVDPNDPISVLTGLINRGGCSGPNGDASAAGVENFKAADKTGGLTFSICADDWTSLFSELASEVAAAVPCTLEIPAATNGGELDLGRVNVVFTPPTGGAGQTLVNVGSASSCGSKQGWHYDDPETPTQITLCASSCTAAGSGGALDIALGCFTRVQ